MTDEELAAIEARYKATTPGEWFQVDKERLTIYTDINPLPDYGVHHWDIADFGYAPDFEDDILEMAQADLTFMVEAHNHDIPALIAEVRRLRALAKPDYEIEGITYTKVEGYLDDIEEVIDVTENTEYGGPYWNKRYIPTGPYLADILKQLGKGQRVKIAIWKLPE